MGSKPLSPRGVSKLVISNLSCYMGNKIDFMGNLEVIFFPSGYLVRTSVFPFWVVSWEISILWKIWK